MNFVNGLPTYGSWGGKGWSAGEETTGPLTEEQKKVKSEDPLDALFKQHDLYYDAANKLDPLASALAILVADIILLEGMKSLDSSLLDDNGQQYQLAAIAAFQNKIFLDIYMVNEAGKLEALSDLFNRAKIWTWPRDPIILDLDGDGLETVGLSGSTAYFDFDGDGVLSKSGLVGKDDALLVWDKNNNGAIDSDAELFGDFTVLPNGTLAPNGFAALAGLDANDPAFAELKLWRDASQDGHSGQGELLTLAEAGIVSLNLANMLKNQTLANGCGRVAAQQRGTHRRTPCGCNTLAREGSFTRADGTTSAMGEFRLAIDTFDSQFAEQIEVPVVLQGLPTMDGAGKVRELQQAAAQSGSLTNLLTQFQNASSHAEQRALLDDVISAWAATSGMQGLAERAGPSYRIQYDAFGNERRIDHELEDMYAISGATSSTSGSNLYLLNVDQEYKTLIADWDRKMRVLEAFNGQYFFNLPERNFLSPDVIFFDVKSQTEGANCQPKWLPVKNAGRRAARIQSQAVLAF